MRWATLGVAAGILLLAAIAHGALRALVRRKIRRDEAQAEHASEQKRASLHWLDRSLQAAVPPLAVLLWVYAVSAVLSVLLLDLRHREVAEAGLAALRGLRAVVWLAGLCWLLHRLGALLEQRLQALSSRSDSIWDQILYPLAGKTVRLTLPLAVLILGVPVLPVPLDFQATLKDIVSVLLIAAVARMLFELVQAAEQFVLGRYRIDVSDNLEARKIYTQVTVLKKVAIVAIGVFTLASMLMVFDSVRQFGTSILASAGIAGVIIGFAAQRSIATLVAGFQIAITQPIRIDDVVIVENEWGRIEDITLTYVVVRIWDLRRLVLPITYFIEKPFQNWTRASADLLASVFLYVDYTMPVQPLREEFTRILEASPHWDRKVNVLQVTDAKEHTLELRALGSAGDASKAWNLRCEVREKLISFIQQDYPQHLPRLRAELEERPAASPDPGQEPAHSREYA